MQMKNNIPQIIYLILVFIGLLCSANKHGKIEGNHNFWTTVASTIIVISLLYFGGFFDKLF
jgi:hypothetical protein